MNAAAEGCLFCDADLSVAGRAREHVLPQWLLRHYSIDDVGVEPAWTKAGDGTVRDQRKHPLKAMVFGHVYRGCNNGWMSALEQSARPTLLDLAAERATVGSLSPNARSVVARWALKTAVALNRSSNFHQLATPAQAGATRIGRLPDGVIVLAHALPAPDTEDDFWWLQSQGIAQALNPRDNDDILALQDGAWRCFIAFERLGLLTAYARPHTDWRWYLDCRYGTPIWPLQGAWLHRDSAAPPDNLRALSVAMSMSVGLCRADDLRGIDSATIVSLD